ncbi:ribosome recycling factor [bacterium]|uniref:Ribosome-recycling factor n=1 Tax=candidate division WOR-3 bacterium TaxID=2052148 RepID=A0A7C0VBS5_UNCW3|nr:MAG: ribosome recycling factor [bacterium]HDI83517.1 ribosome recycling factor [candidate division WOR-3 bacterium]
MLEELKRDIKERMSKAVKVTEEELAGIRTGRASPSILQNLKVDYYGATVPLNQIASITAPEPNMLIVHPWDQNALEAIEKAILSSNLGLNPIVEPDKLRIPIPPLSEERRIELTKLVKKIGEEGKVAIRNLRREANEKIKKAKNDGEISEDDALRAEREVQELTDKFVAQIDEVVHRKEEEILND